MAISLFETKAYEDILSENLAIIQKLLPDYKPAQGDDIMLVLQAFSYREMALREFFNEEAKGFFLETATGEKLDLLAETLYGLYRLPGAKPYTEATFSLFKELDYDLLIPAGYELKSSDGIYSAYLSEDITIKAGELSGNGVIILDEYTESSTVVTEVLVTPLPYLEVSQNGEFKNGANLESDEAFKIRIKESLADKSTTGSERTYRSFTLKADKRVEDVKVFSPSRGVAAVIYYSRDADELMRERIESTLYDPELKTLTDYIFIGEAKEIAVDVYGEIVLKEGVDASAVYVDAIERLRGVSFKIGEDVSVARLIDLLMVDGVNDVKLNTPTDNIKADEYSIAVLNDINISYRISNEL